MAIQNQLTARAAKPADNSLSAYLAKDAVKNQINQIVGSKDGAKFISSLVSAVQTNPQLQECTKQSLLSAALLGHSLNLSPSPQLGQFYMVPYKKKEKKDKSGRVVTPACVEAMFQIGFRGLIQLAVRSGYYKRLNALPIKEGELVRYDPLSEDIEVRLIENEEEREKAPTAGYFAMFEYSNGFKKTMYWSKSKMISHADRYSQAFSANATTGRYPKVSFADYEAGKYSKDDEWLYSSFWYKDFDSMAIKTMLRQIISKWGIMSIDMQEAMVKDMAVIKEDLTPEYVEQDDFSQPGNDAPMNDEGMTENDPQPAEPSEDVKGSPAGDPGDIENEFFG